MKKGISGQDRTFQPIFDSAIWSPVIDAVANYPNNKTLKVFFSFVDIDMSFQKMHPILM